MDIEKVKMEITKCLSVYGNSEFSKTDVLKLTKAFVQRRLSQGKYTPKEALYAIDCISNFEGVVNYYKDLPETGAEILANFPDEIFTIRGDIETEKENIQQENNTAIDKNSKQIVEFLIKTYNQNKTKQTQDFMGMVNKFIDLPQSKLKVKNREYIQQYIQIFLDFIQERGIEDLSGKEILQQYGTEIFKDVSVKQTSNQNKDEKVPEL